MSQGARWKRRLGVSASVLVIVGGLLAWLVPHLLQRTLERRLHEALQSQGLEASWSALRWRWSGAVSMEDIELRRHPAGDVLASVDWLEVEVDVAAVRAGAPRVERLDLGRLELHTESMLAWRASARTSRPASAAPRDDAPSEPAPPPRERRPRDLGALLPNGLQIETLHIAPLPPPLPAILAALTLGEVRLSALDDNRWRVSATWRGADRIDLPAPAERWHLAQLSGAVLAAELDATGDVDRISLRADQTVTLRDAASGAQVSVGTLQIAERQTLTLEAFALSHPDRGQLSVAAGELRLTAPFEDIASMRMERLRLEDVHGTATLRQEADETAPSSEALVEASDEPAEQPAEPDAEDAPPARSGAAWIPESWASRPFWEQLPQFIEIDRGSIALRDEDHGTLTVAIERFRYGLRVLQSRMEFALAARLETEPDAASQLRLEGHWHYGRNEPTLRLRIEDLALGPLRRWIPALPPLEGTLDLDIALQDERSGPDRTLRAALHLNEPRILREDDDFLPAERRLSYVSTHEITRDGRRQQWRATEATLTLDDFEMGLGVDLDAVRLDRWPPLQGGRVQLHVDEGPAQSVWERLPSWLTEGLGQPRFAGTFGLSVHWGFEVHTLDDGRHSLRFRNPWGASLADATLRIENVQREVDPRRLADDFTFMFRGPQDRIMRRLHVPTGVSIVTDPTPPLSLRQIDPHGLFQEPDQPWNHEHWARLDDISWYLIAMQLFREDGSFFRNDGMNWFQLRRVLEEAVDRRRLGRGASTITMQLVKNTLLSHERSLQRKFQEVILAYWVTRLISKERILEIYLNVIEWGPDVNGIVEASAYYFDKHPRELNLGEATWLSAITPSPARYSRQRDRGEVSPGFWRFCQDLMRGLHRNGWITEAELQRGLTQRPRFVTATCDDDCPAPEESTPSDRGLDALFLSLSAAPAESDNPRTPVPGLLRVPPAQRIYLLIRSAREPGPWQRRP